MVGVLILAGTHLVADFLVYDDVREKWCTIDAEDFQTQDYWGNKVCPLIYVGEAHYRYHFAPSDNMSLLLLKNTDMVSL